MFWVFFQFTGKALLFLGVLYSSQFCLSHLKQTERLTTTKNGGFYCSSLFHAFSEVLAQ